MKHQILGLLEIRQRRGLQGETARGAWVMDAIEVLLRCELERQEKEKSNADYPRPIG